MKRHLFIIVLFALSFIGCETQKSIYNVTCIHDDANSITLRCNGYGKSESDAIANAGKNAVEQLLYRGVPNSNQRNPLIGIDESAAKSKHNAYLNDLFGKERYLSFLTQSTLVNSGKDRGTYWSVADITINLRALRLDLEQAGIIRKFGL